MTTLIIRSRATTALLWTAQIAAAALFLSSGTLKLAGAAPIVQVFAAIGIGQWFRYATMIGAVLTHLVIVGGNVVPAGVLLVGTSAIAWMRRPLAVA